MLGVLPDQSEILHLGGVSESFVVKTGGDSGVFTFTDTRSNAQSLAAPSAAPAAVAAASSSRPRPLSPQVVNRVQSVHGVKSMSRAAKPAPNPGPLSKEAADDLGSPSMTASSFVYDLPSPMAQYPRRRSVSFVDKGDLKPGAMAADTPRERERPNFATAETQFKGERPSGMPSYREDSPTPRASILVKKNAAAEEFIKANSGAAVTTPGKATRRSRSRNSLRAPSYFRRIAEKRAEAEAAKDFYDDSFVEEYVSEAAHHIAEEERQKAEIEEKQRQEELERLRAERKAKQEEQQRHREEEKKRRMEERDAEREAKRVRKEEEHRLRSERLKLEAEEKKKTEVLRKKFEEEKAAAKLAEEEEKLIAALKRREEASQARRKEIEELTRKDSARGRSASLGLMLSDDDDEPFLLRRAKQRSKSRRAALGDDNLDSRPREGKYFSDSAMAQAPKGRAKTAAASRQQSIAFVEAEPPKRTSGRKPAAKRAPSTRKAKKEVPPPPGVYVPPPTSAMAHFQNQQAWSDDENDFGDFGDDAPMDDVQQGGNNDQLFGGQFEEDFTAVDRRRAPAGNSRPASRAGSARRQAAPPAQAYPMLDRFDDDFGAHSDADSTYSTRSKKAPAKKPAAKRSRAKKSNANPEDPMAVFWEAAFPSPNRLSAELNMLEGITQGRGPFARQQPAQPPQQSSGFGGQQNQRGGASRQGGFGSFGMDVPQASRRNYRAF